jgi:hypothetical protein
MQTCAAGYALTHVSVLGRQLDTRTVVGLTAAKLKPLMPPVHDFRRETWREDVAWKI